MNPSVTQEWGISDDKSFLNSRRTLIVSTTEDKNNKLLLFFKSRQEKPPTYNEAVLEEETTHWRQVSGDGVVPVMKDFQGNGSNSPAPQDWEKNGETLSLDQEKDKV